MCSEKCHKIHCEVPVLESLSYKVTGLRPTTLLKERFGHKCFPVDFMELLLYRTPPVVASVPIQLLG